MTMGGIDGIDGIDEEWDPSRVEPGQLVLMPSMRFGLLHSIQPDGKRFFIAADGSCMLCAHGEKGSTVATWCLEEQAARRNGVVPKKRSSVCDCQTACGLFMKRPEMPRGAPPPPASLFDHLCAIDAPTIVVKGREARRLPFSTGEQTTFLTSFGDLVCQHGKGRSWLLDKRRPSSSPGACSCKPVAFPQRTSLVGMQLGRYAGQYGRNKKRPRHAPTLADVDPADTDRGADTDPAADTDHGDTDREAEPAERAEPTDAAERADAAEPAEPIEPIEPTDAIHAAEPIDHSAE